jgi:uncharacterized protein (TIRG00374 family)
MVVGLIVFFLYLYFTVEIEELFIFLSGVDSTIFFLLFFSSLGLIILSVLFWGVAWRTILEFLSINISYRRMFLVYWAGYFVDLVAPLENVGGDLARIYLLKKETGAGYGTLASSAVTFRLVSYFVVMAGLIIAAVFLLIHDVPLFIYVIFFSVFVIASIYLVILMYLAFSKNSSEKIANLYFKALKIFRKKELSSDHEKKVKDELSLFYKGFMPFRQDYRSLRKPLFYHSISYLSRFFGYVLIFYAFGLILLPVEFFVIVFFIGSAFQDAIGSLAVGSLDIFLVSIFGVFGLETGISGVIALLLRSADFWFPLVIALAVIQIMGFKNIMEKIPKEEVKGKAKSDS